jgi:AcrR family transcriptional regulator
LTERRHQILRAAERLLGQYGPSKTTMADVARAAEIGVGSVYLEFPSKDAIVEELSTARHQAVLAAMKKAAESMKGSFRDRLAGVFEARTATLLCLADEGAHACELVHCASSAVKAARERFADEELGLVASLLREGARAGEFSAAKPELLARTILRAYVAFSPPWLFERPRDEVRASLGAMHRLVLEGVLARSPP